MSEPWDCVDVKHVNIRFRRLGQVLECVDEADVVCRRGVYYALRLRVATGHGLYCYP